ncbi:MAG TPA: ATP synthase F1 subunit gamma [Myxococcaceae bacterium]
MASLRDIRKRIRSVKSTRQITKAMKMVAAAKLRRAQDAIIAARPYSNMLDELIRELAARSEGLAHPLLQQREAKKVELLVLTSDRGLAGGFNSNIIRRAGRFLFENKGRYERIQLSTIGRKGNDFFKKQPGVSIRRDYAGMYSRVSYREAANLAQELSQSVLKGEVDAVFLVYNEFLSAISQRVTLTQMLPLQSLAAPEPEKDKKAAAAAASLVDFKYEPDRQGVLDRLVPQALAIKIYRALLESVASEHGARMSAMESATNNASDMIGKLTLLYNRTRQAVITKELMEIVSGAEAQKG